MECFSRQVGHGVGTKSESAWEKIRVSQKCAGIGLQEPIFNFSGIMQAG